MRHVENERIVARVESPAARCHAITESRVATWADVPATCGRAASVRAHRPDRVGIDRSDQLLLEVELGHGALRERSRGLGPAPGLRKRPETTEGEQRPPGRQHSRGDCRESLGAFLALEVLVRADQPVESEIWIHQLDRVAVWGDDLGQPPRRYHQRIVRSPLLQDSPHDAINTVHDGEEDPGLEARDGSTPDHPSREDGSRRTAASK